MKLNTKDYEEKMKKTVSVYEHEVSTIRAGRANPAVLDKITVDYYGSPTPINQIAAIKVTDARTIAIQPFKTPDLKAIEKAINASDLGMHHQNDGKTLSIFFPSLPKNAAVISQNR